MKVTSVKTLTVNIPLSKVVQIAGMTITAREYCIVMVETDEGITGTSVGYTRNAELAHTIERYFAPLLMGEDPLYSELLWRKLYNATRLIGRKGVIMRSLALVDCALWDIKGKWANLPLYQLLGGVRDRVPVWVAGGYQAEGEGLAELEQEIQSFVDAGYDAVKLFIGVSPPHEDIERIRVARAVLGSNRRLMIDVNGGWHDAKAAVRFARLAEPYDLAFIEEPFQPENLPAMEILAAATDTPLAIGEMESGRDAFRELLTRRVVDILRPDATVVGGITEWLKIAGMAQAFGKSIMPHDVAYIHVHLVAAFHDTLAIEFANPAAGISNFDLLMTEPFSIVNGWTTVPQRPGLGLQFNWETIQKYTV
jgi:D-arabinonate dehydratase